MVRLPEPGGDSGNWGKILNTFLETSHNNDGTLKSSALQHAGGVTIVNGKSPSGGSVTLTANDVGAPTALANDSDVQIASPINNQVLTYDGGTGKWTNQNSASGVSLDTNPADIQPLGVQAQGGTGLAADAGHVHAMPRLDQINSPTATVSLGSHKITNLANGTASTDAAAFGQIPTTLPPNGSAAGDLSGSYPAPTVTSTHLSAALPIGQGGTGQTTQQTAITALTGTQTSGKYLRSNGTDAVLANIQAGDVPTLNQNTTGTAANITATLDQVPAAAANVNLNSHKLMNLANGTLSTDAAAFGQIPTTLPPNGSAGGDLSGSYPNPAVAKLNGVAAPASAPTGSGQVLTTTSTSATAWQTPASAPVSSVFGRTGAVLAQAGDYTAAQVGALPAGDDLSTIAAANATAANVSMNSHKITGLANGTASTDAAAFGQIPVIDGTAADIQPLGTQSAGSFGKAADSGHVHPTTGLALLAGATFTGPVVPAVVALTDATTIAVNAALGNDFRVTLGGNRTLGNPTNPVDGQKILLQVTQDATGSRTLSYGTAYEFSTGLASPTLSTVAGTTDLLGFVYNAAKSKWLFVAFLNGFS